MPLEGEQFDMECKTKADLSNHYFKALRRRKFLNVNAKTDVG